ncbi:MAG: diphosphatase [Pseudomonadota bacterium]
MILPNTFEAAWEWREPTSASDSQPPATGAFEDDEAHYFCFHRGGLLVSQDESTAQWPVSRGFIALLLAPTELEKHPSRRFIGYWQGQACWGLRISQQEFENFDAMQAQGLDKGLRFEPLRALFNRLPDDVLAIAGRAIQILEFDRSHRYCGACANPTLLHEGGRSRRCPSCGETSYPRVAPAMMVLIKRDAMFGRQLLLARSPRFPAGMYSALAGFVEPSESIESCIHREAFEEVGVRLRNIQYFGSQSWPFPHSLMIAYVADYAGGEIQCQEGEIEDARWFTLDALPQLPHRLSIARRLIDGVIAQAS